MSSSLLNRFKETPISFDYPCPSEEAILELRKEADLVVLKSSENLRLDQTYFRAGHEGASSITYTRLAVAKRLEQALDILHPEFGLVVMDAYRSIQTQKSLFNSVASSVQSENPSWTHSEVLSETRKFVVHPEDQGGFKIPPHNSGGAIDITLHRDGELILLGSVFDEPSIVSSTGFFESEFNSDFRFTETEWLQNRINRRILFHTMIGLGFTNYANEWWHYDLGDCMWADALGLPWIFPSMACEVEKYERTI